MEAGPVLLGLQRQRVLEAEVLVRCLRSSGPYSPSPGDPGIWPPISSHPLVCIPSSFPSRNPKFQAPGPSSQNKELRPPPPPSSGAIAPVQPAPLPTPNEAASHLGRVWSDLGSRLGWEPSMSSPTQGGPLIAHLPPPPAPWGAGGSGSQTPPSCICGYLEPLRQLKQ